VSTLTGSLTKMKDDESSSVESEKPDQGSFSSQSLTSSPSSLEQEISYEKMNEKDLNVYLVFKLYVEKEEK